MTSSGQSRANGMRTSRIVGIALLIGLLVNACAGPESVRTQPEPASSAEIIVFTDGDGAIYTIEPDGDALRQLTPTMTDDRSNYASHPAISPDGTRIAFTRGSAIAVMNVDGDDLQVVAERAARPAFSPDGSKIVFECAGGLCVINSDGTGRRQLSPENDGTGDLLRTRPAFSTDGSKIVFNENGYIAGFGIDGNGWFQVLRDQHWNSDPAYSPDGSTILFSSNRGGRNQSETYSMTPEGRDIRPLTTHSAEGAEYSPDGSRIAYTHGLMDTEAAGAQIWVMNSAGSEARRLTPAALYAQAPSWGPSLRSARE
ncbi:hypothetical protein [Prescottella equi]